MWFKVLTYQYLNGYLRRSLRIVLVLPLLLPIAAAENLTRDRAMRHHREAIVKTSAQSPRFNSPQPLTLAVSDQSEGAIALYKPAFSVSRSSNWLLEYRLMIVLSLFTPIITLWLTTHCLVKPFLSCTQTVLSYLCYQRRKQLCLGSMRVQVFKPLNWRKLAPVAAKRPPLKALDPSTLLTQAIVKNISDRQQTERAFQQSQRVLTTLLENLPGMVFRRRYQQQEWVMEFVSEGCLALTGYPASMWLSGQVLLAQVIHPEDLNLVLQSTHKRTYQIAYRLMTATGEIKWIWEQGTQASIGCLTVEGLMLDITERQRAEEALQEAEAKYRSIFENTIEGIFQTTRDGKYLSANPALARIYGYSSPSELLNELTDIEHQLYVSPQARSQFIERLHADDLVIGFESQIYRKDGSIIWISENARAVRDRSGNLLYYEGTVEDITERRFVKTLLAGQNRVLEMIAKGTELSVVLNAIVQFLEEQFHDVQCRILLFEQQQSQPLIDTPTADASCNSAIATLPAQIAHTWENYFAQGLNANLSIPILSTNGQIFGLLSLYSDTGTDRHANHPQQLTRYEHQALDKATQLAGIAIARAFVEQQLHREAFYDSLTRLPNRAWLMKQLERAITRTQSTCPYCCQPSRCSSHFAVLFLDLDGFKVINDSLGHLVGDRLLQRIARRLESCLAAQGTVARLGGDEFTILLDRLTDISQATAIAEKIHAALATPFDLDSHEVFTSASIGIVFAKTHPQEAIASVSQYERPEELLRDADIAMYRAKALGRGHYAVFDATMHAQAVARLQLETELRRAIERQEFLLYYQPIVTLATGQISGFEALIRWRHPELGMVSPAQFIPIAEETGLIIPIGRWVLWEACRQMRDWQQQYPHLELSISVNLSGCQLAQPNSIEQIDQILQQTGLPPHSLKLEITESTIMETSAIALSGLQGLKQRNLKLCIDDFGTGYSSLSRLHQLPIHTLKIDKSFVSQIQQDGSQWKMMGTIVTLARNLGMEAIAEGVETAEQLELLRSLQCQQGQGYFFSPPVEAQRAQELLAQFPRW
ncbi:MAG: EAL domain-containing protein [Desertifilum sp. SIO1I2]|nr:EAL domain-containing protein [Desertifilum sp. SIO1I2]